MLDEEDEDGDIVVRFLRKAHRIDNAYVDPVVEDIQAVHVTSIKVVFPSIIEMPQLCRLFHLEVN